MPGDRLSDPVGSGIDAVNLEVLNGCWLGAAGKGACGMSMWKAPPPPLLQDPSDVVYLASVRAMQDMPSISLQQLAAAARGLALYFQCRLSV